MLNKCILLQYAIFDSNAFTNSTDMFRYFYKKHRRKSIAIQKGSAKISTMSCLMCCLVSLYWRYKPNTNKSILTLNRAQNTLLRYAKYQFWNLGSCSLLLNRRQYTKKCFIKLMYFHFAKSDKYVFSIMA